MLNEARDQSGRPKSTLLAMCSAKKVKKSQKNCPATIRKEEKNKIRWMESDGRSTAAAMLSLDIDEPQRSEFFQPFPEDGRTASLEGRRI
jgi:hypothetical protein